MTIEIGPVTINLWFLGIAGAVVAAIGLAINSYREHRKREHEIAVEYSGLAGAREVMWSSVREAYKRFCLSQPSAPKEIDHLLNTAGMPPDVGWRNGRDVVLWPAENASKLNHDQRLLWDFVTQVYPPRNGCEGEITDHTFVDRSSAKRFHSARAELAHFWDRAGRAVSSKFIQEQYQSARFDLILLSWFDIALKQWTHDPDEGKVHLFRLGYVLCGGQRHSNAS